MKFIKKNIKLIGLLGFLLLYLFYLWPTAYGYLGKVFVPVKIPQEFYSANQWLKSQGEGFKVIFLPTYRASSPSWAKDKVIGDFPTFSSFQPSFFALGSPYFKTYLEWLTTPDLNSSSLGKFFSFLAIRFFIFHNDLGETHPQLAELEAQKDLTKIFEEGLIKIFENKNWQKRLYTLNSLYLVAGGLGSFKNLVETEQFDPAQSGVVFTDRQLQPENQLLNFVEGVVLENESTDELLPLFADPKYFIFPADSLKTHLPNKKWSTAGMTEPLHGPWQTYLEEKGLKKCWQFNYNKNFIFTWATKILPGRFNKEKATHVPLSNFKSISPHLTVQDNQVKIEKGSEGIWQVVTSDKIKVLENTGFTLQLQLVAHKVKQLHPKILYFDQAGVLVESEFVFGGQDGKFKKKVSFDFITPPKIDTFQIQLWALENPEAESRYLIKRIALYQRLTETEPNNMTLPFEVEKDKGNQIQNDYFVLARIYKNQKGGEISLSVDGELLPHLETLGGENNFKWERVGKLNLRTGKHTLTITNLRGFNAIGAIAILPTEYFETKENEIKNFLKNKKIIYTFSPETGEKNINLSHPAQYYIALKLPKTEESKPYIINVNGKNSTFYSSVLTEKVALASVNLVEGQNKIKITRLPKGLADLTTNWISSQPDLKLLRDASGKSKGRILAGPVDQIWRQATTDFIPVEANSPYSLILKLTAQNANQIHAKVVYYDSDFESLKTDFISGGIDGDFLNREFSYGVLTPPETSFIKLQIWANPPSTGETTFRIESLSLTDTLVELKSILFWPASQGNFGQLFANQQEPPQVSFNQTGSGSFRVDVSPTDSPFLLVLTESYNPLWRARFGSPVGAKTSKLVSSSFPLYSMLNGFYFEKAPGEPIILEFVPQKYFIFGLVSILLALMGGIFLAYKKRKG